MILGVPGPERPVFAIRDPQPLYSDSIRSTYNSATHISNTQQKKDCSNMNQRYPKNW